MALVANNTKISIPTGKLPAGYTDTAGVNLASSQPSYSDEAFTVAKSTVEAAVKVTTFDALRVALEALVAARLTADDIGTVKTANYNIDWKQIEDNQQFVNDFYNDTVQNYICTVDIYIVLS